MLLACLVAFVDGEACCCRSAGRYGNKGLVLLHFAKHPVRKERTIIFLRSGLGNGAIVILSWAATIFKVERQTPMPCFFVGNGWRIAMTLLCMNVNDNRFVCSLHAFKDLDKFFNVVSFFKIFIFEAPGFKPVVFACAAALTQSTKVFINSTMVFGNRHLIVVNYNNNARAEFRCLVKAFKRLTARERAIAYYGYNVFIGSFNVASLLQPCG